MKIKTIYLIVGLLTLNFIFQGCSNETTNGTATIQLKLVDAPDDTYKKVMVDLIDVQYNKGEDEGGWTSFEGYPVASGSSIIDLLTLTAGNSELLANQVLPAGKLKNIRLVLGTNNTIEIEGESSPIPLKTPSAQQSGLKLKFDQELVAGYSYSYILDWDVQKSIVKAGGSNNYNLKPTIRVIAEATSGIIAGRIADSAETEQNKLPINNATIYVFDKLDVAFLNVIASTQSNALGEFKVQGLEEGNYLYMIVKDGFNDKVSTQSILVEKGKQTEVGTLLLTKIN